MWYKNAIIYQLHVRTFADGNGDGIGDFAGLASRLDHIERLGANTVWLLPFYPSPLRDDGYDIADYCAINPDYGTLRDFRRFLREAHARGLRVVTELVLNHTSDQHAWFQRARRAKAGSALRDFYVWSDSSERYAQARIIFQDFETSNWSWDPLAKAYYWHRFYSHQPDLNFDNPKVQRELLRVVDFWLDMGVDGLRLDAVPYLFEREGTSCENLPETHAFLKTLRAHVDAKYQDRMLLAEANQWPEDAVAYFGQGDECHMAFHFPIMPRIFMSLWMEDRNPILDILEQTPAIPQSCQWALFLRNHDELTLEMVSDEERDYMYRAYAKDVRARINLGIRRRLAPLMQNNRRKLEVINFLLLSFHGTPIIYYGDEIGMGDNYHLGDRNGVRTPMQWSPDRNAGFSRANPQRLCLPVIIDPEFHYEAVNVETQEANQSSLLWWMRRVLATYKRLPALGQGSLTVVASENPKVLSMLRMHGEDKVLVVVNLSRFAQVAVLNLAAQAGLTPVEVFGQTRFPAITAQPYVLTLGAYEHFWLQLEAGSQAGDWYAPVAMTSRRSAATWRGRSYLDILNGERGRDIFSRLVGNPADRWQLRECKPLAELRLSGGEAAPAALLVEYAMGQEPGRTRLVLLSWATGERLAALEARSSATVLARVHCADETLALCDGLGDPACILALLGNMANNRENPRETSAKGLPHGLLRRLEASGEVRMQGRSGQSLTCVVANEVFLKIFLQPEEGINPEVELPGALDGSGLTPELLGVLSHRLPGPSRSGAMVLAVAHAFEPGCINGLQYVQEALLSFLERAVAAGQPGEPAQAPLADVAGDYMLDFFHRLGKVLGAIHCRLQAAQGPAFAPQPFTRLYIRSVYQALRNQTRHMAQQLAAGVAGRAFPEQALLERFSRITSLDAGGQRIRIHGDFELSNVLYRGKELLVVDFDGDVRLPLGERRIKRSALRDVAAMLVSLRVAAAGVLHGRLADHPTEQQALQPWLQLWQQAMEQAFLEAYVTACGDLPLWPQDAAQRQGLLDVFVLERLLQGLLRARVEDPGLAGLLMDILLRQLGLAESGNAAPKPA